ncbi:Secreted effector protein pipB2 [Aquisphaera giovannonii]|uniref:Secreted effector protein pipB2 n=2 Tax=Aquisphaera giovannonii TaxID=406548 RepID=A0A5B9WC53_9BACT|nr:Secreted effector protein pipB2 [Aquisphaera giovannonii]
MGVAAKGGQQGPDAIAGAMGWTMLGGILGMYAGWTRAVVHPAAATDRIAPPAPMGPQLWDDWLDDGREEETIAAGPPESGPENPQPEAEAANRPLVRPRVLAADGSGESMPLHDEIGRLLQEGSRGAVALLGGPGSGKTSALLHLVDVLPPWAEVDLGDGLLDDPGYPGLEIRLRLAIHTGETRGEGPPTRFAATFRLAPWDRDDRIEYLLKRHPDACSSVMARLAQSGDEHLMGGNPELTAMVLDRMAEDPAIPGAREALLQHLDRSIPSSNRRDIERMCFLIYQDGSAIGKIVEEHPELRARLQQEGYAGMLRLLRHAPVRRLLAARDIAGELSRHNPSANLASPLPLDLLEEVGRILRGLPEARGFLRALLVYGFHRQHHAMAASLLHLAGRSWRPEPGTRPGLAHAQLEGICWMGVDLTEADLHRANLARADLSGASLLRSRASGVQLIEADLRRAKLKGILAAGAKLRGADLAGATADFANLARADLTRANLEGASLQAAVLQVATLEAACLRYACLTEASLAGAWLKKADLRGAELSRAGLEGAIIDDANFAGANLQGAYLCGLILRHARFAGASFAWANMKRCDLEGMTLEAAPFAHANLEGAMLTHSAMPGASFRRANLRGAGLAGINWPRADLGEADLSGASFHLGSSRSGHVGSAIACEGSRTGFYADDLDDALNGSRPPEEIRKANLRGANLVGATIEDVDFYLVDLRDAKYDDAQAAHFRACGAIL